MATVKLLFTCLLLLAGCESTPKDRDPQPKYSEPAPKYEACTGKANCTVCTNCSRCKWCKSHPALEACGVKKAKLGIH